MERDSQTPVRDLRISYDLGVLTADMLAADPIEQFGDWFAQTLESQILEPNAMVVSTVGVDSQGNVRPASRTVLLKDFSQAGLVFSPTWSPQRVPISRRIPTSHYFFPGMNCTGK